MENRIYLWQAFFQIPPTSSVHFSGQEYLHPTKPDPKSHHSTCPNYIYTTRFEQIVKQNEKERESEREKFKLERKRERQKDLEQFELMLNSSLTPRTRN